MARLQRQTSAYARAHEEVRRVRGAPAACEDCSSTANVQWANVSGEYLGPEDYRPLCASCHTRQDRRWHHDRTQDHVYDPRRSGQRTRCRICEQRRQAAYRARFDAETAERYRLASVASGQRYRKRQREQAA